MGRIGRNVISSDDTTVTPAIAAAAVNQFGNFQGTWAGALASPLLNRLLKTVYAEEDFGVSAAAAAADNSAAIAAMLAAVGNNVTIIWPVGVIQISEVITQTGSNQLWLSAGTGNPLDGTILTQTDLTKAVLNTTGKRNGYRGIIFDGNGTDLSDALVDVGGVVHLTGSSGSGYVHFIGCGFQGYDGTTTTKAGLKVETWNVILDNCTVRANDGNGLYLGANCNTFHMRGGSITSSATGATASMAGLVCNQGYNQTFDTVSIETNGNAGVPTTGGVMINAASLVRLVNCHHEGNLNYEVNTVGVGKKLEIDHGYFLGMAGSTTAILIGSGPDRLHIHDCYSSGHTNFVSITSTATSPDVHDNYVADTNYLAQNSYNISTRAGYAIVDSTVVPTSTMNLIEHPPPSGWALNLAGAGKWEHCDNVWFENRPTILTNRDGANACTGTYTITISDTSNSWLRGKWLSCSLWVCTSDGTARNVIYSFGDGTSLATETFAAPASYAWAKIGGAFKVDAAATSVTLTIGASEAGYDIYVGGIAIVVGIDTQAIVGFPAPNAHYYLAAVPSTGVWNVGRVIWDTNAASGAAPGWYCTTAPLTFKAMANLA